MKPVYFSVFCKLCVWVNLATKGPCELLCMYLSKLNGLQECLKICLKGSQEIQQKLNQNSEEVYIHVLSITAVLHEIEKYTHG